MNHLLNATTLVAGAAAGALLAGVFALLLDASLIDAATSATVMPSLINCAAAGSLVARCITR
jgi:hypothetical protein